MQDQTKEDHDCPVDSRVADHAVATHHASFNTLVLFSVTTTSAHFVTTVSPHPIAMLTVFVLSLVVNCWRGPTSTVAHT